MSFSSHVGFPSEPKDSDTDEAQAIANQSIPITNLELDPEDRSFLTRTGLDKKFFNNASMPPNGCPLEAGQGKQLDAQRIGPCEHEQRVIEVVLESLNEGVIILNESHQVIEANSAALKIIGRRLDDALGRNFSQLCQFSSLESQVPIEAPIQVSLQEQNDQVWYLTSPKRLNIAVQLKVRLLVPAMGTGSHLVVILRDISRYHKLSQQLEWQANHDSITGLHNRLHFEENVSHLLMGQQQEPAVLAQLDIDHFKLINDICGNIAADQLLGQIALLLKEELDSNHALARIGADEFGILYRNCSLETALESSRQIQDRLKEFRFHWKDKQLRIGLSTGLTVIDDSITDVEVALSQADTACYTAKSRGEGSIQVFSCHDWTVSDLRRHQEWSLVIRDAIEEGQFYLYRQPIVSVHQPDAIPHHYEVLLRMIGPEGEIIEPGQFLPTAERYHLMPQLDQWVVEQSIMQLESILGTHYAPSHLPQVQHAINLSGDSLSDEQFLIKLIDRISRCKIARKNICFEITETAAIHNLKMVQDFIKTLKQMGCRFSLDDFGAGMCSFGYLGALPVDYIKIDGKFIRDLAENSAHRSIVESIVNLAQSMNLETIAEHVETAQQIQLLQDIGVDYLQGYALGHPKRWKTAP